MIFSSFERMGQIALTALLFYLFIIVAVRVGGKRSTSKMNNFDWIVTIALGSIAGSTILSQSVELIDGCIAAATLIALQWIFTKISVYSEPFSQLLHANPRLLVFQGQMIREAMKRERVTEQEIYATLREHGVADIRDAWAVVLESDAEFSVIERQASDEIPVLAGVESVPEHARL